LQRTHSNPGGTNCPDSDHWRPIVGQQQVFTAGPYLGRHSDAQGCFLASLKATTIGGSRPKGVLKAAQHFLPGRPRSCGEGLAAYALALEARAGTAILTNLCIVRFERWCFRAPNWMTASGHEETRRPRDPRDRSSSVTGPRCGGWSGAPVKAPRRGRRATTDQAQQPCLQAHGRGEGPRRPENWEGRR